MNRILRSFLILLIAGTSAPVLSAEDDVIEEIVVTGTRIKRSNFESSAPLTVIDSADLLATGTTNVAEYINKMPQSVAALNSSNTVFHSAVSGINVTDLRLLGEDRTLVLVNVERALIALDVELAADGSVQCLSAEARADGCAPYNPFGAGTITLEAINYLKAPGTSRQLWNRKASR